MRVPVELGERRYEIIVEEGGLQSLGAAVAETHGVGRCVVVTSPRVGHLYLEPARRSLLDAGFQVETLEIPDGEAHKTLATWQDLVRGLLAAEVDRKTPVIALGGGVTGDLVGFAAATVKRGVPLVQVPTTLLAMVDSAVGGKTAVNTALGKNLVGAFYQPSLVVADTRTLLTLVEAEIRCGLGEVLKYGMIWDPSILEACRDGAADLVSRDLGLLGELVRRSCEIKAEVVVQDEQEAGLRSILNFGHTVGHALETSLGHGTLRHGECVAIGMVAESRWAARRAGRPATEADELTALLRRLDMAWRPPKVDRDALLGALEHDKKWSRGKLRTAVLDQIGRVHLERVERAEARRMLDELPLPLES